MTTITRRSLIGGVAATAIAPSFACAAGPAAATPCGCCCGFAVTRLVSHSAGGDFTSEPGDIAITPSSGDTATDHFLGLALMRIARKFEVAPGFGFFDDGDKPNAFATDRTLAGNGPGTVLMGKNFFRIIMTQTQDSGLALITMCAHEFGHIHQYSSSYRPDLEGLDRTVKPLELHADFLAGFYLADRKAEHPEFNLQTVGVVFEQIGDTHFSSPQHHGTSAERLAAITAGFEFGKTSGRRIDAAAEAGVNYVQHKVYAGS
jgi:hypothetical protein